MLAMVSEDGGGPLSDRAPSVAVDRAGLAHGAALAVLLILALAVRLPGIDAPPLDSHHVRQADTASIARVMAREGVDLLHPRIAWAGPGAGVVESEFPLYAAITAWGWRALGATDGRVPAWPRVVSVLAWLVGGLALAAVLRRRLPEVPVWLPLLLYALSPLGVVFSRSIQPDALAVALLLLAVERADAAGGRGRSGSAALLAAALLVGLAVACKGTMAFWLPLVLALALRRPRPPVSALVALVALPVLMGGGWYLHAHQHLGVDGASFKIWGSAAGKWASPAVWFDLRTWRYLLGTAVSHSVTVLGVVLVAAGVAAARRTPEARPWLVGLVLGALAMLVVTAGFRDHSYYQLPLVPFASVLAGVGAWSLWTARQGLGRTVRGVVGGGLALLAALTIYQGRLFVAEGLVQDTRVGVVAASAAAVLPSGVATVVVDRHPQTLLYALDQRGWHRQTVDLAEVARLEEWGADALLITDESASWADQEFVMALRRARPLVARGEGWNLLRLRVGRPLGPSVDAVEEGAEPADQPPR